jgi:hypothetical protein
MPLPPLASRCALFYLVHATQLSLSCTQHGRTLSLLPPLSHPRSIYIFTPYDQCYRCR